MGKLDDGMDSALAAFVGALIWGALSPLAIVVTSEGSKLCAIAIVFVVTLVFVYTDFFGLVEASWLFLIGYSVVFVCVAIALPSVSIQSFLPFLLAVPVKILKERCDGRTDATCC